MERLIKVGKSIGLNMEQKDNPIVNLLMKLVEIMAEDAIKDNALGV